VRCKPAQRLHDNEAQPLCELSTTDAVFAFNALLRDADCFRQRDTWPVISSHPTRQIVGEPDGLLIGPGAQVRARRGQFASNSARPQTTALAAATAGAALEAKTVRRLLIPQRQPRLAGKLHSVHCGHLCCSAAHLYPKPLSSQVHCRQGGIAAG